MNKQYYSMMDDDFQSDSFIRSSVTKTYNPDSKNFKRQEKKATISRRRQAEQKRNWD